MRSRETISFFPKRSRRLIYLEGYQFFKFVEINLMVGLDLSEAWRRSVIEMGDQSLLLRHLEKSGFFSDIEQLENYFKHTSFSVWFATLRRFYEQHLPVREVVSSISEQFDTVLQEELLEFEQHTPQHFNLGLIFILLPPLILIMAYFLMSSVEW